MIASRNIVLWIEDRPNTVQWEKGIFEKKGYKVEFRYMPHDIKNFLTINSDNVVAIIVDIMLRGVPNLESIGKVGFYTDHGLEAGWVLIHHFLRCEDSEYKDIPILILSVKECDDDDQQNLTHLRSKGGSTIQYLQKLGMDERIAFVKWVDGLNLFKLSEK